MSRKDNEQIKPKKQIDFERPFEKFKPKMQPARSFKETETETQKTNIGFKNKAKIIGKKISKLTPIGQVKSIVDTIKDITKKDTGIKVNKGNQKSFKVNTGRNLGAGSSNPRRVGVKRGGSMCKLAIKGKGKAYGKNS